MLNVANNRIDPDLIFMDLANAQVRYQISAVTSFFIGSIVVEGEDRYYKPHGREVLIGFEDKNDLRGIVFGILVSEHYPRLMDGVSVAEPNKRVPASPYPWRDG
jgi:hypothetical protein